MTTAIANGHAPFRHRNLVLASSLAATAVVAIVIAVVLHARSAPSTAQVRFETAVLARGPLQAKITASGTLSPLITVQVGSNVSGTIKTLGADFNSQVKKGQVIATIDPRLFEAAVETARANVVTARGNAIKAEAQLEDANRQAKRTRELLAQNLIAQADADTADANAKMMLGQLEAAKGASQQAESALHQAEINLAYTTITSPIDGVVISRNVDVGQTVAATLASPTLFAIAQDLKRMQVDSSIAEADVGRLKEGMKATFTVDAYPNETFEGAILQVRNAPQTIQNVVTYDAVIEVDNSALKLKPGMTANATVVVADRADVLKAPNAALRFKPSSDLLAQWGAPTAVKGDHRVLWLREGDRARAVVVRTGVSDGTSSEVLEGPVKAGDTVVTEAVGQGTAGPGSYGRVF